MKLYTDKKMKEIIEKERSEAWVDGFGDGYKDGNKKGYEDGYGNGLHVGLTTNKEGIHFNSNGIYSFKDNTSKEVNVYSGNKLKCGDHE